MSDSIKPIDLDALEETLREALGSRTEDGLLLSRDIDKFSKATDRLWDAAPTILAVLQRVRAWAAQGNPSKWTTKPSRDLRAAAEALQPFPKVKKSPPRKFVVLKIEKCGDCPHLEIGDSYSLDGWDRGSDWFCKKAEHRKIAGFVERPSQYPKEVPCWCPLKKVRLPVL